MSNFNFYFLIVDKSLRNLCGYFQRLIININEIGVKFQLETTSYSKVEINFRCGGGLPSQAFEYIHAAPGLMSEADYPYTAKDGNCTFDPTKAKVNVLTR